mmetsp:Transcript_31450/g.99720  ORF Transcript_31450/g.99720 Transcript_31450/m.99720 type:complete len:319 (-) Transcript_31450:111-1067(-)
MPRDGVEEVKELAVLPQHELRRHQPDVDGPDHVAVSIAHLRVEAQLRVGHVQLLPDRKRQPPGLLRGVEHVLLAQPLRVQVRVHRRLEREAHVEEQLGHVHGLHLVDEPLQRVLEVLDLVRHARHLRLAGAVHAVVGGRVEAREHAPVAEGVHHEVELHEAREEVHGVRDDDAVLLRPEVHRAVEGRREQVLGRVEQVHEVHEGEVDVLELVADLRRALLEGLEALHRAQVRPVRERLLHGLPHPAPVVVGQRVRARPRRLDVLPQEAHLGHDAEAGILEHQGLLVELLHGGGGGRAARAGLGARLEPRSARGKPRAG